MLGEPQIKRELDVLRRHFHPVQAAWWITLLYSRNISVSRTKVICLNSESSWLFCAMNTLTNLTMWFLFVSVTRSPITSCLTGSTTIKWAWLCRIGQTPASSPEREKEGGRKGRERDREEQLCDRILGNTDYLPDTCSLGQLNLSGLPSPHL